MNRLSSCESLLESLLAEAGVTWAPEVAWVDAPLWALSVVALP